MHAGSEFVRLLGHEPVEYNQEQARMNTYDGAQSLIRSFPSKVGVSIQEDRTRACSTHTHTHKGEWLPETFRLTLRKNGENTCGTMRPQTAFPTTDG